MFAGFRATFSIPQRAGGLHFVPLWHGVAVLLDQFSGFVTSLAPWSAEVDALNSSPSFRTWMIGLALAATTSSGQRPIDRCVPPKYF